MKEMAGGIPLIVKGVLTVEGARKCVEAGADAIVVSNHGGRVLDDALSTIEVLPEIAAAVKGQITILVDGAPVHLRCLNILSNYLGFGLSPAVSACLVYALDKKTVISRKFKAAVGCEVVYLLLLTALLPSGMVFSVSEDNVYARGPYLRSIS